MLALTVAFFTAALALAGKVVSDRWLLHQQTCSIAAALAGEIDGVMRGFRPENLPTSLLRVAGLEYKRRSKLLLAAPRSSLTHPVFDKVADKIGLLPIAEASDVSRVYSNFRSKALNLTFLSSSDFSDLDDEMQVAVIKAMVKGMEDFHPLSQGLVTNLTKIANRKFWHWPVQIKLAVPGDRG